MNIFSENLIYILNWCFRWTDGRSYQGDWVFNEIEGFGIYKWPNGVTYKGDFLKGKKHGFGILTWPDGRTYTGQWEDGYQHGEGTYYNLIKIGEYECNGTIKKGIWNKGKREKWAEKVLNLRKNFGR